MKGYSMTAGLVLVCGLATGRVATANILTWANPAGGLASASVNWSPNQVPLATDDLSFSLAQSYNVTFNSSVATSRTHTYRSGTVVATMTAPHLVSNGMVIGDQFGDSAHLTVTTGSMTSSGNVIIARVLNTVGVLNVNDSDADFIVGNGADLIVANGADGVLNVTNLGHVQVGGSLIAGVSPSSFGNATVTGGNVVAPFGNSFLDVQGLQPSFIGQAGDFALTVSSGAQAKFAADLQIASNSGSVSSVTVQTAALFQARLNVGGDLLVGQNTTVGAAAGAGTLNVSGGGAATVGGALLVGGDPDGGTGLLSVSGNGVVTAGSVIVGAGGSLAFTDGTITVNGGLFSLATSPVSISDATGTPTLVMQNGATASLPGAGAPSFRALVVGGPGANADGLVSILGGSQVELSAGGSVLAVIGDDPDDRGEIDVDGVGSRLFSNNLLSSNIVVGGGGTGTLNVTGRGSVTTAILTIGSQASSFGVVHVQDPASQLRVNHDLFVGGSAAGNGGFGQLYVRNGGIVDVTDATVSTVIYDQGIVSIDNATFNSTGIVTNVNGAIFVTNGLLNATEVRLDSGQLQGGGNVNARINMGNASLLAVGTSTIPATPEDLTVGNPASVAGFVSGGSSRIQVHAQCSLTIQDLDTADAEVIELLGGSLVVPNGLRLLGTSNVSGNGTISGNVTFTSGGVIAPDSTGIRLNGTLTRLGGTISGGLIGFNSGGGYSGGGTIGCTIDADAGSVITANGILTMGNAASNFGCTLDGALHCGTGTVNLLDANGIGLGSLTDLNGATLVCAQNLTVNAGRTIEGTGFVQTPLLTLNGAVKPADLPSVPPRRGTLNVSGAVTMGANNNYFCDIDPGIEFATADRIQSSGAATINGALTVAFIDGYVPQANQIFDIVVGSSRTGVFSSTSFPPVGSFGPPHVEYTADRARIIMCYVNCDGSVVAPTLTANDFQCFLNRFASQDPYANCDGSTAIPVLTANDFQCFLNKFASGCN